MPWVRPNLQVTTSRSCGHPTRTKLRTVNAGNLSDIVALSRSSSRLHASYAPAVWSHRHCRFAFTGRRNRTFRLQRCNRPGTRGSRRNTTSWPTLFFGVNRRHTTRRYAQSLICSLLYPGCDAGVILIEATILYTLYPILSPLPLALLFKLLYLDQG